MPLGVFGEDYEGLDLEDEPEIRIRMVIKISG